MKTPPTCLLVDLCGTLVLENTTQGFLRSLGLRGMRGCLEYFGKSRVLGRLGRLFRRDLGRAVLLLSLRGKTKEWLELRAWDYVESLRKLGKINSRVLSAIQEAQTHGAKVYLATASLDPIAEAVCRQFRLSGYVSSSLAYRNGRCRGCLLEDRTGRKWAAIAEILGSRVEDYRIVTYTDNPEDVDLIGASQFTYFFHEAHQRVELPGHRWELIPKD